MSDLKEQLEAVKGRFSNEVFLSNKGLSNEVGIHVFCYEPENEIIVTGYFNPLPRLKDYKEDIDEVIKYYNNHIEEIGMELDIKYVDIFDVLEQNKDVFSNPIDIHPNKKGYELISKEIIKNLDSWQIS